MRAPEGIKIVVAMAVSLSLVACQRSYLDLFPDIDGATGEDATPLDDADAVGLGADAQAGSGTTLDAASLSDVETADQGNGTGESGAIRMCPTCNSSTPFCDTTIGVCVECIGNPGDCPSGQKCNQISNTCELPCNANTDCTAPDVCDLLQHLCADCTGDSDCQSQSTEPVCVQDTCVPCRDDSTCGTRHCKNYTCVDCLTTSECSSGRTCVANACK